MKGKTSLLIVIGLLLTIGSIYYWTTSSYFTKEKLEVTEYSDVDTSDWQIYTNEKFGYTMLLPQNYRIEEGDRYLNIYSDTIDEMPNFTSDELKIIISIYDGVSTKLDEWINTIPVSIQNVQKEDDFIINNENAKMVWGTTTVMGTTFKEHRIFYRFQDRGVVFSAIPSDSSLLDIYYGIVNSFKFD